VFDTATGIDWTTRPHHTHACQHCGLVFRPALQATVGVQFLPGFKNALNDGRHHVPSNPFCFYGINVTDERGRLRPAQCVCVPGNEVEVKVLGVFAPPPPHHDWNNKTCGYANLRVGVVPVCGCPEPNDAGA
jgi:hypothetical protein